MKRYTIGIPTFGLIPFAISAAAKKVKKYSI